jgi:signal transduction histidine kinase
LPTGVKAETVTRLVSEAVRWTRDIARSLSPVTLEGAGFVAAMEELAQNASVLLGVECTWNYTGGELQMDRKRALHLFRIVQEAISNSVKHGKAKHVTVGLTVENGNRNGQARITLTVSDDGSGLSEQTVSNPGLGLRIMRYRARMVDAVLAVERMTPQGGTIVTCNCPLSNSKFSKD